MKLGVYGLKRLKNYFNYDNLNIDGTKEVNHWIVEDLINENNKLKVRLVRGYSVGGKKKIIAEKTITLKKEEIEAIKDFEENKTVNPKLFWCRNANDLMAWLMKNYLV